MRPKNPAVKRLLFYLFLLGFFTAMEWKETLSLLVHIHHFRGGILPSAFYAATYLGLVAGALILYTSRNGVLRWASYALSLLFVITELGFKSVNGSGYGFQEATMVLNEYEFTFDALSTFAAAWVPCSFVGFLFVTLVAILCTRWLPGTRIRYTTVTLLFVGCMWFILNRNFNVMMDRFPAVFKVPAVTALAWTRGLYQGPRAEPYFLPAHPSSVKHIVLIVDESIRGDVLSINGNKAETTPYLQSLGGRLINLGVACAGSNQSFASHVIIQNGLRLEQIPDREHKALKQPSIFQYARASGRKTFIITAQSSSPKKYLSRSDYENIDAYISVREQNPEAEEWEADHLILDRLEKVISSEAKTFVYIVKNGAHYKYDGRYPESARVFRPTMSTDQIQANDTERSRLINSYYNAVRWSVDGFFHSLVPLLKNSNCIVVYTSDHGQSLTGARKSYPHATVIDPPREQANVPLFLIGAGNGIFQQVCPHGRPPLENRDRLSHFHIFPTLLCLMGYDKEDVKRQYGPTIYDDSELPRYFISGDPFARSRFSINPFDGDANR